MNYEQTTALFEAMEKLELYAKMWQYEMDKGEPDWNAVERYRDLIAVSRKKLFNAVEALHAE